MNIRAFLAGKYLGKDDVPEPMVVTVKACRKETIRNTQDGTEGVKLVIYFDEFERGMVLNKTNMTMLYNIMGTDETETWIGKQVILRFDPSVGFQGKITGGLRIGAIPRPPKSKLPPVPERQPGEDEETFTA